MNKYKLINTKTKEEHLCDKVTIDGFEYYVSDEERLKDDYVYENNLNQEYKISKVFKRNDELGFFRFRNIWIPFSKQNNARKVIATNNPNIDIPKVVDEVNRLAYEHCDSVIPKDVTRSLHYSFKCGYNKSQETHPFSTEDMIEFNEWCDTSEEAAIFWRRNRVDPDMSGNHWKKIRENRKKLLQFWKEQQPKIVYYNE